MKQHPFADHTPENIASARPRRHPNPDLVPALRHRVFHHTTYIPTAASTSLISCKMSLEGEAVSHTK